MGKTWDLWFGGELSGQAETVIHTALLSLCATFFFFFSSKTYKDLSSPGIDGVGEIRPC